MFELGKKNQAHAASDQSAQHDRGTRAGGGMDSAGSRSQTPSGQVAVIGRSIKIDGDLRGEEDLRIEGDVTGTIHFPNHNVTIGSEGRIKAGVYAESVTIDGEMNGDVYGSDRVSIRKSARMAGNIVASRVSLEEGARFKGSIDMDPERVEAAFAKQHGAPVKAAAAKSRPAKPVAAIRSVADDTESEAKPAH